MKNSLSINKNYFLVENPRSHILICRNCGKNGHHIRDCNDPRSSFGIICYYLPPNKILENIKLLMICRKHSITFIDFIRGKYNLYDPEYLTQLFERMTNIEKKKIKELRFKDLWFYLWNKSAKNTRFIHEYYKAYEKFLRLKNDEIYLNGKIINLDYLVKKSGKKYKDPEWVFPKGKREHNEVDLEVAKREFSEETGVDHTKTTVSKNFIEEIYQGSDSVFYKNKYYFAKSPAKYRLKINKEIPCQALEVSKIAWVSFKQAYNKIRPYYIEKIKTLNKVKKILENNILS